MLAPLVQDGLLLPGKRSKTGEKKAEKAAAVISPDVVLPNGHIDHDGEDSGTSPASCLPSISTERHAATCS